MKRICLLSDSHGARIDVENLIMENNFDYVFFLGDGLEDFEFVYTDSKIEKVCGNCDFFSRVDITKFVNVEDKRIMITHGHHFRVKLTMNLLVQSAKQNFCDIVCFGHTHIQEVVENYVITFINPGSFRNGEYAILTLEKNKQPQIELCVLNKTK